MKIKRIPPPVVTGFINVFTCTILMLLFTLPTYSQSGEKWASNGNAVTSGSFLGTTNNNPLLFKANNNLFLTLNTNGDILVKNFAAIDSGLVAFDINGKLIPYPIPHNDKYVLLGNGKWGPLPIPNNYWKLDNNTNHLYTLTSGNVGIGTQTPVMKLDINGDAIVRGYLYVDNGVIIGKRIESKTVDSDTLRVNDILTSKQMYSDSLSTIKVDAENLNASKAAAVGGRIFIDGPTSSIYSGSNQISFRSSDITTTGNITATSISAQNLLLPAGTFTYLNVSKQIKVGANTLILENDPGGLHNSIYTHGTAQNEDLFIQSTTLNNNNTIINFNNGGKVGIGTNNPDEKLHVRGPNDYFVGAKFENDEGYLKTGFNGAHGIIDSDREILMNWYSGKDVVVGGGVSQFWNEADGGAFNTLHNTSLANINGKVTLFDNPQNPAEKFEIIRKYNEFPEQRGIHVPATTGSVDFYVREGSINSSFNFYSKQAIGFSKLVLSIRDTGNVGIGINDPMQKLEIGLGGSLSFRPENNTFGKIYFKSNTSGLAGKIESFADAIGFYGDNLYCGLTVFSNGNIVLGPKSYTNPMTNLNIRNKVYFENRDGSGTITNEIRVFENDNNLFVIKKYLSAQEDISLFEFRNDGNLLVKNKIFCNEIEVVLDVLPDYVFEENYNLLPISEVDKFIKENKHLPGVPSQSDVSEYGLNVGEFNAILLKKIEELTLYIIKQDEEIEKLKKVVYTNK